MSTVRRSSFFLLAVGLLKVCQADLPIHCLKHQIVGDWKLEITEPTLVEGRYHMNCGHEAPDNPSISYLALRNSFKPVHEFTVSLDSESKVTHEEDNTGAWTMIYDEGFDIHFKNHRFTSFFEYYPEDDQVKTYCGQSLVGWYIDTETNKKACFRAEKILKDESEKEALYAVAENQMYVVNPKYEYEPNLLQIGSSSKDKKNLFANTKTVMGLSLTQFRTYVEKINNIPGMLWKAEVPKKFEGMSLVELNKMAGRSKSGATSSKPTFQNLAQVNMDVSDLPKEFSWKHVLKTPRDQGGCGSCYALATLQMLEARLKIKYDIDEKLSLEHAMSCSPYNQGCAGGYPFLVEKYANEYDLVPESCNDKHRKRGGACQVCDIDKLERVYRVGDYKFIGGAYGKSNERNMMEEIMKNGPIAASFNVPGSFMGYKSGIFHDVPAEWVVNGLEQPEWTQVTHSVLLYGWGETENGDKYWELLNSWGEDWGDKGHFKLLRGVDSAGIESLGEAADPIVIEKNKTQ